MTITPAIAVYQLKKAYKGNVAVNNISFEIPQGSIFGLLGPNGAGKTTTIRMLSGLLKPDGGTISYLGQPLSGDTIIQMGLCPQELAIWDNLTVMEQLLYVASLYDIPQKVARARAHQLLEHLHLSEQKNELAHALSGGMKRRLNILLALMHDPQILILDEPQAGLDPQSRLLVRDYIRSLRGKKTVLITTHDMEEAEKLLDIVAIIDHGNILVMDQPKVLKNKYFENAILQMTWEYPELSPESVFADLMVPTKPEDSLLPTGPGFRLIHTGDRLTIDTPEPLLAMDAIHKLFEKKALDVGDLEMRRATLEDIFIHLTGRSMRE